MIELLRAFIDEHYAAFWIGALVFAIGLKISIWRWLSKND